MEVQAERNELEREQLCLSAFLSCVREIEPETKRKLAQCVRRLARCARSNQLARSIIEKSLQFAARKYPAEAITFRTYYLTGEAQLSARIVGRSLFIRTETVHRHIRRIAEEMLPCIFGFDGVFSIEEGLLDD